MLGLQSGLTPRVSHVCTSPRRGRGNCFLAARPREIPRELGGGGEGSGGARAHATSLGPFAPLPRWGAAARPDPAGPRSQSVHLLAPPPHRTSTAQPVNLSHCQAVVQSSCSSSFSSHETRLRATMAARALPSALAPLFAPRPRTLPRPADTFPPAAPDSSASPSHRPLSASAPSPSARASRRLSTSRKSKDLRIRFQGTRIG